MGNKNFKKMMQSLRETANLTQTEIAQKVGISTMSYHRYECGERIPDVKTAIRISDALGVEDIRKLWSVDK